MTCKTFLEVVSSLLPTRVDRATRLAVRKHTEACETCRAHIASFKTKLEPEHERALNDLREADKMAESGEMN